MQIVLDQNIIAPEIFTSIGEVTKIAGQSITNPDVRDADILLVRSKTTVNQQLLEGSKIKFVGTATSGEDHIDKQYLTANKIAFASSLGANAGAVVDYVIASLLELGERTGENLADKIYGIVGMGHIGTLLHKRLNNLGYQVLVNDPLVEATIRTKMNTTANKYKMPINFCGLKTLVTKCDIISIHTNLTTAQESIYPSYHLFNQESLALIKPNAWLINTSRGAVVSQEALLTQLYNKPQLQVVLDVWETEPNLNLELINKLALATAHIAGYSLDAKYNATLMLYAALCQHVMPNVALAHHQNNRLNPLKLEPQPKSNNINSYVRQAYNINLDDAKLRSIAWLTPQQQRESFYALRTNYNLRRDFTSYITPDLQSDIQTQLNNYGFSCV